MSKDIKIGKEARQELVKGIDILADAVVSTLGPNGRNVVISNDQAYPQSTKDGVTVAKSIELKDHNQNLGVNLIKQAAVQTASKAGDGTTTSTLLTRNMVKGGLNALDNRENAVAIKRDMETAANEVIEYLKTQSRGISSEDQLKQVASISANNDPKSGAIIAQAIEKVGVEGIVHVEPSHNGETYLETVEGMQFNRGYKSPYLVTDNDTMSAVLKDPLILIADATFTQPKALVPVMQAASAQGKPLLVIANDVEGQALATVIVNKMRTGLSICAVKAPEYGDRKKLILEDIAIATGGTVFSPDKGHNIERFRTEWFGGARSVTIEKDKTTIVDGKGTEESIEERAKELTKQIELSKSHFETEKLQERIANFAGGVAIIHVGGNTETEINETKDRVDDALHATKAAIQEGLSPGGGIALLKASRNITSKSTGANIVREACLAPFQQILVNAGKNETEAYMLALNLLDSSEEWEGYDVFESKRALMDEIGVFDPTKVTRTALQNAISVAGSILLTECTVVDIPEETNGGIDPSMMGMM